MITSLAARAFFAGIFLLPLLSSAQKITTQGQFWMGYFNTTEFGKKWFLYTELENRMFLEKGVQNLLLIRPHLHYKVHKHWDVAVGFAYFLVSTQDYTKPSKLWTPEYRPFEEVNYNHTFGKRFTYTARIRVEQRFIHKAANGELIDGFNFNWRFRWRPALDILVYESEDKKHALKLRINDELMFNVPTEVLKNYFDQNRLYAGLQYKPAGSMAFELGYMWWFQERPTGGTYFNRHILRLSVHHKISFPVKEKAETPKAP